MAYERKTIDTWELQLNYGYGWEYTLTEFTREEARRFRKCLKFMRGGAIVNERLARRGCNLVA